MQNKIFPTITAEAIEKRIFLIRGYKIMLDNFLARLYEVPTGRLNEQVRRNLKRFPSDFMFQLTWEEYETLKSKMAFSNDLNLKSQNAISSSEEWGGRRYPPYAFTEQGVAMLSSVLNSDRAVEVNIEIMRAFVRFREMISTNTDLARKLAELEYKYDAQFKVVFDAIRKLMNPPQPLEPHHLPPKPQIGFLRPTKE